MKRFDNKVTGILSSSDLKTFKGKFLYWFFFAILLVVCFISLFPSLWTILTAFKETQEIYGSFTLLPKNKRDREKTVAIKNKFLTQKYSFFI